MKVKGGAAAWVKANLKFGPSSHSSLFQGNYESASSLLKRDVKTPLDNSAELSFYDVNMISEL